MIHVSIIRRKVSISRKFSDKIENVSILIQNYENELNKIILDETLLFCLSQNKKIVKYSKNKKPFESDDLYSTGFYKLRMWAQYGDNNRGVCLCFSREKLKEVFRNQYINSKIYSTEVKYNDDLKGKFSQFSMEYDQINNDFKKYVIDKHIPKKYENIFFKKTEDWKDEQEYRFVIISNDVNEKITINISAALTGIFLGIDFPEVYIKSLLHLLKNQDSYIYKLYLGFNRIPDIKKIR